MEARRESRREAKRQRKERIKALKAGPAASEDAAANTLAGAEAEAAANIAQDDASAPDEKQPAHEAPKRETINLASLRQSMQKEKDAKADSGDIEDELEASPEMKPDSSEWVPQLRPSTLTVQTVSAPSDSRPELPAATAADTEHSFFGEGFPFEIGSVSEQPAKPSKEISEIWERPAVQTPSPHGPPPYPATPASAPKAPVRMIGPHGPPPPYKPPMLGRASGGDAHEAEDCSKSKGPQGSTADDRQGKWRSEHASDDEDDDDDDSWEEDWGIGEGYGSRYGNYDRRRHRPEREQQAYWETTEMSNWQQHDSAGATGDRYRYNARRGRGQLRSEQHDEYTSAPPARKGVGRGRGTGDSEGRTRTRPARSWRGRGRGRAATTEESSDSSSDSEEVDDTPLVHRGRKRVSGKGERRPPLGRQQWRARGRGSRQ